MARLVISCKREHERGRAARAFALRRWLMDVEGWATDDLVVGVQHPIAARF